MSVTPPPVPIEESAPRRRAALLQPFRSQDFRLLWSGLLVSNLGTWMQLTTLGYIVVKLAGGARVAALDVGILGASAAIPVVLLSPFGGVVADRISRRSVLFATNGLEVAVALALALLATFHRLGLGEIYSLSALRAAGQSFDAPARQSWVPLLVSREHLGTAIGLNSVAFNAPSVIGPPIAGFLIAAVGIAASFYINAVATLAVVLALVLMKPAPPSSTVREGMLASMRAGFGFLFRHAVLRSVLLLLVAISLLVRPYGQLLPAYAAHVVHVGATGLGFLLAASGAGAIVGSFVTALVRERNRAIVWFASALMMAAGTIGLGFTDSYPVALAALVVIGLAVLSFAGSSNVLLQSLSPEDLRGRSVAAFSMIILGGIPLGSLVLGTLASAVGLPAALIAGGTAALGCAGVLWWRTPALRGA